MLWAYQVALVVKNPPASAGDVKDAGSIPGLGRSPGGGSGNPLQYSSLENPMDRGAWWAIIHRVAKSQTQLKRLSPHAKLLYNVVLVSAVQWSELAICINISPPTPLLPSHPSRSQRWDPCVCSYFLPAISCAHDSVYIYIYQPHSWDLAYLTRSRSCEELVGSQKVLSPSLSSRSLQAWMFFLHLSPRRPT